jgi:hypothetical protein
VHASQECHVERLESYSQRLTRPDLRNRLIAGKYGVEGGADSLVAGAGAAPSDLKPLSGCLSGCAASEQACLRLKRLAVQWQR